MSNQSLMVVATKYQLKIPISIKTGTWDKKGAKEKIHTKIVPRLFVEQRNEHNNNEVYVIDEKATEKMVLDREANIKAQLEKKKTDSLTTSDLINAVIGNTPEAPAPTPTPTPVPENTTPEVTAEEKVMHILTKDDMDANSVLAENGLKVGDEVELDKDGNILFETK